MMFGGSIACRWPVRSRVLSVPDVTVLAATSSSLAFGLPSRLVAVRCGEGLVAGLPGPWWSILFGS